jgi:hypothetical protein
MARLLTTAEQGLLKFVGQFAENSKSDALPGLTWTIDEEGDQ